MRAEAVRTWRPPESFATVISRDGAPAVARAREGRPDLLETGEVGLLEDEADVRVRDQLAAAVDDVGAPCRADPDLGHDVPDELQVDLGDRHPRVAAAGDRERQVGLGLLPEVDGPEVGPARPRLLEPRIAREVGLAADDVHGEPRDAELLPARRVELAHLGDRGRLALEADELEAPLLDRLASAELPLARPSDLALDVADEGLDPPRGAGRLLPLQRDESRQVLPVGEVELDEPAGEQSGAHQEREEHDVLPEQPASRPDDARHASSRRPARRGGPRWTAHSSAALGPAGAEGLAGIWREWRPAGGRHATEGLVGGVTARTAGRLVGCG